MHTNMHTNLLFFLYAIIFITISRIQIWLQNFYTETAEISVRFNSKETLESIELKIKKIIAHQKRSNIYQIQFA